MVETCYCCSCYESDGYHLHDSACRNHGFDGQRPCELHGSPGYKTEIAHPGKMPDSVQKKRTDDLERYSG